MGSSGKKKTTMAKLARETRLRERRVSKQAKKDARKLASAEHVDSPHGTPEAAAAAGVTAAGATAGVSDKDLALRRLRESPDEELAVFEDRLRQDALAEGASELELREAQSGHPGHG